MQLQPCNFSGPGLDDAQRFYGYKSGSNAQLTFRSDPAANVQYLGGNGGNNVPLILTAGGGFPWIYSC